MAIVKCPDCRADVSTLATRCPRCGRSEQAPFSLMMAGLFLAFTAVMALGLVLELAVWRAGEVVDAWATGSVILGVLALVARRRHVAPPRRSRRLLTQEEKAAVDRAHARRKADGEL